MDPALKSAGMYPHNHDTTLNQNVVSRRKYSAGSDENWQIHIASDALKQ
jgi:hypothetical protein